MRFNEFKVIKEAAPVATFYTIGDSHAKAIGDMGRIGANNLAVGATTSTNANQLSSINKIPAGSTVVIAAGHNDAANAARASAEAAKKSPPVPPARIAANVAAMVNAAKARGLNVIYVLFPNGTYDKDAYQKYYKGQYILQVRDAIKASLDVPIIDLEGAPLPDGVHASPGKYKEVADTVKSMMQKSPVAATSAEPTDASGTEPAAASGTAPKPAVAEKEPGVIDKLKDMVNGMLPASLQSKKTFTVPVPQGRSGTAVRDVQQALEQFGYTVGPPGLDGIRGPYTTAAVKKFQADHPPLEVDGDPGPETVAVLNQLLKNQPKIAARLTASKPEDVKSLPAAGSTSGANKEIDPTKLTPGGFENSALQEPTFMPKVKQVANNLSINPSVLLSVMRFESKLNPQAVNPYSNAVGLIQFMPTTAQGLGTSSQEIYAMTATEQLDYVEKYYKMNGVKPGATVGDLYLLTFMPAALNKRDNFVLGDKKGGEVFGLSKAKIYAQNSVFDKRGKGYFTVGDVKRTINSRA